MISENGTYWSTGITVTYQWTRTSPISGAWSAELDYCDDGFAGDDNPDTTGISTEGVLRTRYAVSDGEVRSGLSAVIDTLILDAQKLGISFSSPIGTPSLYIHGDGKDEDFPPPANWREMLVAEAKRIGWRSYGFDLATALEG